MAARTTTHHHLVESGQAKATQPGALDHGFAKCACGFVSRHSLGLRFALIDHDAHARYMNRKASR